MRRTSGTMLAIASHGWRHLIFVSLPPPTPVGDLRLAEAIVHEAMH